MRDSKISSLEKIGYQKELPKGSDINDFEVISVTQKNGDKINRLKKLKKLDLIYIVKKNKNRIRFE